MAGSDKNKGFKSMAFARVGGQVVAYGTSAFVAQSLGIKVSTLRRWRTRGAPPGVEVRITPLLYKAYKDGESPRKGTAHAIAASIGVPVKQVCNAAKRRHKADGWMVVNWRIEPFALPGPLIKAMMEEEAEKAIDELYRLEDQPGPS